MTEKKQISAESQIKNIARRIRKILQDSGGYNPRIGYHIDTVASDIVVYRRIRSELLAPDSKMARVEITDAGNERVKTNPLIMEFREQSKVVMKGLDLLTMNIKSNKVKSEVKSALAEFMEAMKEEEDD